MRNMYRIIQAITIALLAVVAYSNMHSIATAQGDKKSPPLYPAVYIGPTEGDTFVKAGTIQTFRLAKVHKYTELAKHLTDHPETAVIYIHPQKIAEIDTNWLRQSYERGVTVVAINTSTSSLASLLGEDIPIANVQREDIPVADLSLREDAIIITLFSRVFDRTTQEVVGTGWHSHYYRGFDAIPQAINVYLYINKKIILPR